MLRMDDELELIKKEIAQLTNRGNRVDDLDKYITALHELNEVKDSAQIVMGKLAETKNVTVEQIHKQFELTESKAGTSA